jgi:3-oxoacyl-[acyl-carrier-protein] synthase-1
LAAGRSGLAPCAFETVQLATWVGAVEGIDADAPSALLPAHLAAYNCRNNRLALLGLEADGFGDAVRAAIARYGKRRVGLFLATSTSGILETEIAYRHRDQQSGALPDDYRYAETHNTYSVAAFTRDYFGLEGPAVVVSTACSSSAKVFASAQRMLGCGLIDAAVVGGIDSLCLTTLYGFNSLELLSDQPCRPYDAERKGISLGEGAAFALLERDNASQPDASVWLLGYGESSDAYHMSAPHPEGRGAQAAMQAALTMAGVAADAIDYINLHGTATPSNDAAEGHAVAAVVGKRVPCSSTKGATGHTLGAAGAVEAVISALAIEDGLMPGSCHTGKLDPSIEIDYVLSPRRAPLRRVLSNSFGFGGSNCSLLLGTLP